MDVRFKDASLERLEVDAAYSGGYAAAIVKAFRKRMQQIRSAPDERIFYELRSLRFERLKGKRKDQFSMRLNDQWRLILAFRKIRSNDKIVVVIGIEDYY